MLFLLAVVLASWVFPEHSVCSNGIDGPITFTGFRIVRRYKVELVPPSLMHFITLYHCNHGKVDYEKSVRVEDENDVAVGRTFCLAKPNFGTKLHELPGDTIKGTANGTTLPRDLSDEVLTQDIAKTTKQNLASGVDVLKEKSKQQSSPLQVLFRNLVDKALRKISNRGKIQYLGRKESIHYADLKDSDLQAALAWEARNLVCFKVARRRKYARKNILYYMPHTFVGGLYRCVVPRDFLVEALQRVAPSHMMTLLDSMDLPCERSQAIPLLPLIADDATRQRIQRVGTAIFHTIPYLSTATVLNLRFRTSDTNDMFPHTWAKDIEVNEDYNYSEFEINVVLRAIARTTNFIHRTFNLRPKFQLTRLLGLRAHESENEGAFLPWLQRVALLFYENSTLLQHVQMLLDR